MDAIASRLGVAKPTLYRMGGTREELIALSIDAEAERLLEAIHRHGPDGFFTFAEEAPAGFLMLFGGRYPQARQAVRRVEHMVARSMRPAAPVTAVAFVATAAAVVSHAMANGGRIEAERLRSDFDAAAKSLAGISDRASVEPVAGRA
jgi:AcrR family transcriptional regulator